MKRKRSPLAVASLSVTFCYFPAFESALHTIAVKNTEEWYGDVSPTARAKAPLVALWLFLFSGVHKPCRIEHIENKKNLGFCHSCGSPRGDLFPVIKEVAQCLPRY